MGKTIIVSDETHANLQELRAKKLREKSELVSFDKIILELISYEAN